MQILAIYWKNVWESTVAQKRTRGVSHTEAEQAAFDRRMAAMRAADRSFVRWRV